MITSSLPTFELTEEVKIEAKYRGTYAKEGAIAARGTFGGGRSVGLLSLASI
jgi:hypothetical protein